MRKLFPENRKDLIHIPDSLVTPVDSGIASGTHDDAPEHPLFDKTLFRYYALFAASVIFLFAGVIVSLFFLLRASLKNETFTYELGAIISNDPEDYIDAGFLAMQYAQVDLSSVDRGEPGVYEIVIRCPGKKLTADLILEDTIAPRITTHSSTLCFAQGTQLEPSDLIEYIYDADWKVKVEFEEGLNDPSELACRYIGNCKAWIYAADSSGNKSRVCISYIVDRPPSFEKMCDFYVASGTSEDLLKYVRAYDETDGDLTDSISMYPESPDLSEVSDTELTFSVTDSFGLKTREKVILHVLSADDIQKMIGERTLTRENAFIIGAYNKYDTGLFSNRSIETTMIDVMPTVVSLSVDEKNGSKTTGSGFIAQISDSDIYIVTNHHVVNSNTECDVFFYNAETAKGYVLGYSDDYDVAVIKVSLDDLPDRFSEIISTVHIDMKYWDKIKDDDRIELGLEKLAEDGTIEHYTYGLLVKKDQDFEFFSPHLETEMELRLKLGDSGSAVFDKKGRLICMAFAYSVSPERDWAIPLPEIVSSYEEITGNKLYVYR